MLAEPDGIEPASLGLTGDFDHAGPGTVRPPAVELVEVALGQQEAEAQCRLRKSDEEAGADRGHRLDARRVRCGLVGHMPRDL